MVKEFKVYITKGIKGYNPPEYYRALSSKSDAIQFTDEFNHSPIKTSLCNISMDNNMGRVVVTIKQPNQKETMHVILIDVTEIDTQQSYPRTRYFYVGVIDRINNISATQVEISYTIDWYTSYALNYWNAVDDALNSKYIPSLTASTVLYRRLSNGEFDYKDEGFIGAGVYADMLQLKCTADNMTFWYINENNQMKTYSPYDGNLFSISGGINFGAPEYIIYHDSVHNKTVKCIALSLTRNLNDPESLKGFLALFGIDYGNDKPSPDGILFRGYLPIPSPIAIRGYKRIGDGSSGSMKGVYVVGNVENSHYPFYLYASSSVKCTEYNKLRVELGDGSIIYDVPLGRTLADSCTKDANGTVAESNDIIKVSPYISKSLTNPVLTLKIESGNWKQSSTTITLPIYSSSHFIDSYQVYRAEERSYQMAMLSLQSQNELVSGVIGGVNQGAMISAFSRTGARTGKQAMDKGIIGGGIGIVGAVANFAYQTLWANKQSTEITDKYNRCKPDVLAQDGYLDLNLIINNSGIRCYKYDADTITNIKAYQSRFGYQTQKVENNVDLKSFIGYVQADVIFGVEERPAGEFPEFLGLRTEVEQYIKDMFSYGVWFTHITKEK